MTLGAAMGAAAVVCALSASQSLADSRVSAGEGVVRPASSGQKYRQKPSSIVPQPDTCQETACGGEGGADGLMYPFDGSGAWTLIQSPNDDESSQLIELPFAFRFRDRVFSSCFINNNGNVTFDDRLREFTPDVVGGRRWMLAPFWADVDTRCDGSGKAWYRFDDSDGNGSADTLVVTWDRVGYYDQQTDKLNTFQLVMSDGSNPMLGRCETVAFSYGEMCWTTGKASGGIGGFGGVAAAVGVDWTDGGDAPAGVVLGRFDSPGSGEGGVDLLDGATFRLPVSPDPYDLDGSGEVDFGDVATVLLDFGPGDGPTDLDGSGYVDNGDVALLLLHFGPACG